MPGAAAAAAAEQKRSMQEEEENMTGYNKEDLEGWEFKIVRANTRKFKNVDIFQRLCAEEAKAGWEMIEKFDDSRIRFMRSVEKRAGDQYLDIDPYRTHIGITESQMALIIIAAIAAIGLVVAIIQL